MRVLVTGAASGIGRATCLRLARDAGARGAAAKVAAVDLAPAPELDRLADELRKLGADVLPLHGDMGEADAPARVVGEAVARFGGLGAYGPSKAAVIMLVRVLAQELGRDGIRV